MEQYLTQAVEYLYLVEAYLLEISVVLLGLAGIAKLTKTESDNKIVLKLQSYVNKAKELISKVKSFKK